MTVNKRARQAAERVWDSSLRFSVTFEELERELMAVLAVPPLPHADNDQDPPLYLVKTPNN